MVVAQPIWLTTELGLQFPSTDLNKAIVNNGMLKMFNEIYLCILYGASTISIKCKTICTNCGFTTDCSDLQ